MESSDIGIRIKKVRKHYRLTQTEFGEKIDVKKTTVACYENGLRNPSNSVIKSICREFKVNYDWLLYEDGDMLVTTDYDSLDLLIDTVLADKNKEVRELFKKLVRTQNDRFWEIVYEVTLALYEKEKRQKEGDYHS